MSLLRNNKLIYNDNNLVTRQLRVVVSIIPKRNQIKNNFRGRIERLSNSNIINISINITRITDNT